MRRRAWPAGLGAVLLALVLVSAVPPLARPAGAERAAGFAAEVLGRAGWYGSHHIEGVGTVWGLDPTMRAPIRSNRYAPAGHEDLDRLSPQVRRALAWAATTPGAAEDPLRAAAVGLALHDLGGGRYPDGPLDLTRLAPDALVGFEGHAGAVLDEARAVRAAALALADLHPPFALHVEWDDGVGGDVAEGVVAGVPGHVVLRLVDAHGRGVPGVALEAHAEGGLPGGSGPASEPVLLTTDAAGEARMDLTPSEGANRLQATGWVPGDELDLFVPTRRPAQRVVRPAVVPVTAGLELEGVAPHGAIEVTVAWPGRHGAAAGAIRLHREGDGGLEHVASRPLADHDTARPLPFDGLEPGTYIVELLPPRGGPGIRVAVTVEAGQAVPVTLHPGAPGRGSGSPPRRGTPDDADGDPGDAGAGLGAVPPATPSGRHAEPPGTGAGPPRTGVDGGDSTDGDSAAGDSADGDAHGEPASGGEPGGDDAHGEPASGGEPGGDDAHGEPASGGEPGGEATDATSEPDGGEPGGGAPGGGEPGGEATDVTSPAGTDGGAAGGGSQGAEGDVGVTGTRTVVDALKPEVRAGRAPTASGRGGTLAVTGLGTARLALGGFGLVLLGDGLRVAAGALRPGVSRRGTRQTRGRAVRR